MSDNAAPLTSNKGMEKEWWSTPTVAWAFTAIGIDGGAVLTYLSPFVGIPIGTAILVFGVCLLIRAYRIKRKPLKSPLPSINPSEKQWQMNLIKLFHDGEDIQAKLKRVKAQWNASEQVSAEIGFEAWFTDVSNTLKNTEFLKLWYENKAVNYRTDSISDYIDTAERALDRLESIMKLISDKEGYQA